MSKRADHSHPEPEILSKKRQLVHTLTNCETDFRQNHSLLDAPLSLPSPISLPGEDESRANTAGLSEVLDGDRQHQYVDFEHWIKWPELQALESQQDAGIEYPAEPTQLRSPLFWLRSGPNSIPFEFPAELRVQIYEYLLVPRYEILIDAKDRREYGGCQTIHTPILRACRKIHREASEIMYRNLEIYLNSEDIFHLESDFHSIPSFPELHIPRKTIWRHNPLAGIGRTIQGKGDIRMYDTSLLDGFMEPHVFSRFHRINFLLSVADINFGGLKFVPSTPRLNTIMGEQSDSDEIKPEVFISLAKVNIPRILARILKNSPFIEKLSLTIRITGLTLDPKDIASQLALQESAALAIEHIAIDFCNHQSFEPLLELTNICTFRPSMCFFYGAPGFLETSFIRCGPPQLMIAWLDIVSKRVERQYRDRLVTETAGYQEKLVEWQMSAFDKLYLPVPSEEYGLDVQVEPVDKTNLQVDTGAEVEKSLVVCRMFEERKVKLPIQRLLHSLA